MGIAEQVGRSISPAQADKLTRYLTFLATEAIPAGGVGPGELHRLHDRHIGDALVFLHGWTAERDPENLWDLGSGAGLPGIPLAILLPETPARLVERSGRRADLLRRAVRILDLPNVEVIHTGMQELDGMAAMLVSRATLSPSDLDPFVRKHLAPGGTAVVGGSWVTAPEVPPGWECKEIPPDPLDRPVWLLIMRR